MKLGPEEEGTSVGSGSCRETIRESSPSHIPYCKEPGTKALGKWKIESSYYFSVARAAASTNELQIRSDISRHTSQRATNVTRLGG